MKKEEIAAKNRHYASYKPRKAVKLSKRDYKISKRALRKAKVNKEDKEAIQAAKQQVKLKRKVLKTQYKRNGGSVPRKLVKKSYQTSRSMTESGVSEHEVMGDIASKRQSIRQSKYGLQKGKQTTKGVAKLGKYTVRLSYGIGNRGY
ncbi:TPA: CHAP domain-containing protein, partial [Streptococcus suis 92-4172]|nr:CHAP domain-containing protein [Streptococcus suis 92-4172]